MIGIVHGGGIPMTGTSNGWRYKIEPDGRVDAYRLLDIPSVSGEAYGSFYRYKISSIALPFEMQDINYLVESVCQVGATEGISYAWAVHYFRKINNFDMTILSSYSGKNRVRITLKISGIKN